MSHVLPYGWEVDPTSEPHERSGLPTRMRPNLAERATIDRIKQLDADGLSLREIAARLDRDGLDCRGRRWTHTTIRAVLRREKSSR